MNAEVKEIDIDPFLTAIHHLKELIDDQAQTIATLQQINRIQESQITAYRSGVTSVEFKFPGIEKKIDKP